jgi:hypothetical protein
MQIAPGIWIGQRSILYLDVLRTTGLCANRRIGSIIESQYSQPSQGYFPTTAPPSCPVNFQYFLSKLRHRRIMAKMVSLSPEIRRILRVRRLYNLRASADVSGTCFSYYITGACKKYERRRRGGRNELWQAAKKRCAATKRQMFRCNRMWLELTGRAPPCATGAKQKLSCDASSQNDRRSAGYMGRRTEK